MWFFNTGVTCYWRLMFSSSKMYSKAQISKDAYSSIAPDPTFAFVGGLPRCPTLDFVIAFWIVITFYSLLTSLFCVSHYEKHHVLFLLSSNWFWPKSVSCDKSIREWAYTDIWIYQRWDLVPWRSKHPLSIDHTRSEHFFFQIET
jgi:hypothetical protein